VRVDLVDDDDALIDALRRGARTTSRPSTRRALITQTWDLKLDAFPCGAAIVAAVAGHVVTSITYVDTSGTTQTWSAALYRPICRAGRKRQRARITPAYAQYYPVDAGRDTTP
jgi:uncharacterized phiE125 gp8 family phage protein